MGFFDDLVSAGSQAVESVGQYYGFKNGKWDPKNTAGPLKYGDEILGEINGRNSSRHAMNVAGDAANAAKAAANLLQQQELLKKGQEDRQASSQAQAIRATANAGGAFNPNYTTPQAYGSQLGGYQQDFLGV